ncbi:ImuA family protein [Mucilaginibacter sp. NFX135]|uniref:ImuA family protein n=1 Tax=Mucilaginibacter sp. NFX135 TaxID=3402687 RepID=UPI003AFB616A
MNDAKKEIISQLRKDILLWEGFKPGLAGKKDMIGLGPVEAAFPNGVFPKGVIHEFINTVPEQAAACGGFLGGLLGSLMRDGGICVWISVSRRLFPGSLPAFGVEPDRIIFFDLSNEKEVLWVMEEALKCEGLAAVVGELNEISFTQSRRLQLAVEQSRVTGFILRGDERKRNTTACAARWKIAPIPSETEDEMPGIGFPRWKVELLKVRNGDPGTYEVEWAGDRFAPLTKEKTAIDLSPYRRQVG